MYHELKMDGSSQTKRETHLPGEEASRSSFGGSGRAESPHPAERPGQHEQAFSHFDQDDETEATQIERDPFEVADLPTEIASDFPTNPVLVCIKGKDSGKDYTLQNGSNTVGRSLDNDIILSDVSVSRRHFDLLWDGQSAKLRDLGSGNGTQLNGSRVHEATLEDNDVVSAGETEFRYRTSEGVLGKVSSAEAASAITAESGAMGVVGVGAQPSMAPSPFAPPAPMAAPGGFAAPAPPASVSTKPKEPRYLRKTGPIKGLRNALGDKLWLVVGGAVILLLGAILTTHTYLSKVRKAEDLQSANAAVAEAFERGKQAFDNGRYEEAHRAFDTVLRIRASHPDAREYMRRASQAREDQQTLIAAKSAILDGDVPTARRLVESVDRDSEFARDFADLRIEMKRVGALKNAELELQEAVREEDLDTAKRALLEVQRLGMEEDAVAAYRAAIDALDPNVDDEENAEEEREDAERPRLRRRTSSPASATRRAAPPNLPARARSTGGAGKRRAMSLYAAERFSDAANAAGGDLADDIRSFETYYKKTGGAPSRRNLTSLREAVRLDRKISGGAFGAKLKPKLREALLDDAKYRLRQDDDARGCARVREAKTIDPSNAETGRLERMCVGRAIRLAKQAKSLERSNPNEARTLYRRVLSMGPDSSLRRQVMDSLRRLSTGRSNDDDE